MSIWTRLRLLWWELFYGDRTILFRKTDRSADSEIGLFPEHYTPQHYVFHTTDPFWQRVDKEDEEHWTIQGDDGSTLTLIRPKPQLLGSDPKHAAAYHGGDYADNGP